jgi:hypothetical protein
MRIWIPIITGKAVERDNTLAGVKTRRLIPIEDLLSAHVTEIIGNNGKPMGRLLIDTGDDQIVASMTADEFMRITDVKKVGFNNK